MMPHRLAQHATEMKAWLVVLYEPLAMWLVAGVGAVTASAGPDASLAHLDLMNLLGFAIGGVIDLAARGRAYARLPDDQRPSRWAEWKVRLLWSAIGLGMGVMIAYAVNNGLLADRPAFHPLVNALSVGVVALPLIDGTRAFMRILAGKSDVFAGLVIGMAQRRAGGGNG
jgi:hypothetical protein